MVPYTKYNFYNHTFCVFQEVERTQVESKVIDYSSKSGSKYIFIKQGVYRISNHWGRASNCRWRLNTLNSVHVNQQQRIGFANWTDFYPNDELSKLFFIVADVKSKAVQFYHKNSPLYDTKAVVRNANQTSKVIQNIKIVLNEVSWCKHLKFNDFEKLQTDIITHLIYTEKSFFEVKRLFL